MNSWAMSYASAGYAIIPLHTVLQNEDGSWFCWPESKTHDRWGNCGKNNRSAGKHPIVSLAPHGVHSATNDLRVVETWPDEINIGVAGSDTFVGIDIDDQETATALINWPGIYEHCAVRTGRPSGGVHLYIRCAPTPAGLLYTPDGRRIGEVRANGTYLVLPPSRHVSGGVYRWIGERTLLNGGPVEWEGDAYSYAQTTLRLAGVVVADRRSLESVEVDGGPIAEISELPFRVPEDAVAMRQFLSGTYPPDGGDRSRFLFRVGCELYRFAARMRVDITPEIVAGIIKHVDRVGYSKYSSRHNADKEYYTIGIRTQAATANEVLRMQAAWGSIEPPASGVYASGQPSAAQLPSGSPRGSPPPPTGGDDPVPDDDHPIIESDPEDDALSADTGGATYIWDEDLGFLWTGGKAPVRICNFEPVIVEELRVWLGPGIDPETTWRCDLGGVEILLRPTDRQGVMEFRRAVAPHLPPTHIVERGRWEDLLVGMLHYSRGRTVTRTAYSSTGWLPDRDAFLLPSAPGAITPTGIDETVRYEASDVPVRFLEYGRHVGPHPGVDVADILREIYRVSSPRIMVPLMLQALAAPLTSVGVHRKRAVVHLFARTGSFKTSLSKCIISIYGQIEHPESWVSTPNALSLAAHRSVDLPILIDDYKTSTTRRSVDGIIGLIQSYADGTSRGRMGRTFRSEVSPTTPRCLILSTGEDVWDTQESLMARTILINSEAESVNLDALSRLQQMVADGVTGLVGYEWIRWLTGVGRARLEEGLPVLAARYRDDAAERMAARQHNTHARVVDSVAMLMAVDHLFRRFLARRVPSFADEYGLLSASGWDDVIRETAATAEESSHLSPFERLRSEIITALETDAVCFLPRLKSGQGVGSPGAEPIGWIDSESVGVTESSVFGWYKRRVSRSREDVPFSWKAWTQEARKHGGDFKPCSVWREHRQSTSYIRMWVFPRREFFGDYEISES